MSKINSKNLLIMLYYELNFLEELFSLIDSYKHFINRKNDISQNIKERCLPFLNNTSNLLKIKLSEDKNAASLFKKKLEEAP